MKIPKFSEISRFCESGMGSIILSSCLRVRAAVQISLFSVGKANIEAKSFVSDITTLATATVGVHLSLSSSIF